MKFPRTHLFVDKKCPALVSGRISLLAAPSMIVGIISTRDKQLSPPGAEPAWVIRSLRDPHCGGAPEIDEVQIVLEGEIQSGLILLLSEYIKDVLCFESEKSLEKAERLADVQKRYEYFKETCEFGRNEFIEIIERLEEICPSLKSTEDAVSDEIRYVLEGWPQSDLVAAIDEMASDFSYKDWWVAKKAA